VQVFEEDQFTFSPARIGCVSCATHQINARLSAKDQSHHIERASATSALTSAPDVPLHCGEPTRELNSGRNDRLIFVNKASRRSLGLRAIQLRTLETCHATVRVMSATRDQIGISSIGIQSIMPTTGPSRRATKRKRENDRNTDNARTKSDHPSPTPHPPGTGRLVDKAV
jgi:hypothetical protein